MCVDISSVWYDFDELRSKTNLRGHPATEPDQGHIGKLSAGVSILPTQLGQRQPLALSKESNRILETSQATRRSVARVEYSTLGSLCSAGTLDGGR